MQAIFPEQLASSLQQRIPPVILLFGDELLLQQDCDEIIRHSLNQQLSSAPEYQRWRADAEFDWGQLSLQQQSMSLFGSFTVLDIELPEAKPGKPGSDALVDYVKQPNPDQLLILKGPRLKKEQLNSRWFKALAAQALQVKIFTPKRSQLPRFVMQRAQRHQLQLSQTAAEVLSNWFEGNLFALEQEFIKWSLLPNPPQIDEKQIYERVADSSQFDVFGLQESIAAQDLSQAIHRLQRLLDNDIELNILNWMLQREVQIISQLHVNAQHGLDHQAVFKQFAVWSSQQSAYSARASTHSDNSIKQMIALAERIERAIKGDRDEPLDVLLYHLVVLLSSPQLPASISQQLGVYSHVESDFWRYF